MVLGPEWGLWMSRAMTPAARGEGDWAVHNPGREGVHTAWLSESLSSRST